MRIGTLKVNESDPLLFGYRCSIPHNLHSALVRFSDTCVYMYHCSVVVFMQFLSLAILPMVHVTFSDSGLLCYHH